jgi:hypothetical protein
MQDRDLRRQEAAQRIALQRMGFDYQRQLELAQRGVEFPGGDPMMAAIAKQTQSQMAKFDQLRGGGGGTAAPAPSSPMGMPPAPSGPALSSTPSEVPHFEPGGAETPNLRLPGGGQAPTLFEFPGEPQTSFFQGAPTPTRSGMSQTIQHPVTKESITRPAISHGTEADQQTLSALNEMDRAFADPNLTQAIQRQPSQFLNDLHARYERADLGKARQGLTDRILNSEQSSLLQHRPGLHPSMAFSLAYQSTRQQLGGMFAPSDAQLKQSANTPSLDDVGAYAVQNNDQGLKSIVDEAKGRTSATVKKHEYGAERQYKPLSEGAISQIPGAAMGMTMEQVTGMPALGQQGMDALRNIRIAIPKFSRMERLNSQIATSKHWKDLIGQKFDVTLAKLLSVGDPQFVAKVQAYEDDRRLVAISVAKLRGMAGAQTEIDRLVGQGVIPASGEFGPTAQEKWNTLFADLQASLESMSPQQLEQTRRALPPRLHVFPDPKVLTPTQRQLDDQLNREHPSP